VRPLGRRSLFALPLVAPLAVTAAVAAPAKPKFDPAWLKRIQRQIDEPLPVLKRIDPRVWGDVMDAMARDFAEANTRLCPTPANLAATLGIPHDEPRAWTDEEVALTLGIDVQRDVIAVSAMAVPA
jgi:hypothetical protein